MAHDVTTRTNTRTDAYPDPRPDADPGLPPADDPGGAHVKGYSADPDQHVPAVVEPIPLADAPPGGIHVPERDRGVRPTGRSDPPADPGNRVVDPE